MVRILYQIHNIVYNGIKNISHHYSYINKKRIILKISYVGLNFLNLYIFIHRKNTILNKTNHILIKRVNQLIIFKNVNQVYLVVKELKLILQLFGYLIQIKECIIMQIIYLTMEYMLINKLQISHIIRFQVIIH